MEASHSQSNGITVVTVSGRVDSATAPKLESYLQDLVKGNAPKLVLNLEAVEYMSSAGLRTLVSTLKAAKNLSGDLRLCSPSPRVAEVMRLAGLASIFTVFDSQEEAVGSFS